MAILVAIFTLAYSATIYVTIPICQHQIMACLTVSYIVKETTYVNMGS